MAASHRRFRADRGQYCAWCSSPAAAVVAVPAALARTAAAWLSRTAAAAQKQNYVGTIVYQHGGRFETSRLVHLNDRGNELEKLVNLEGPAREVIRMNGEVRCYYPDAKVIRIEPRTFRNAFPSLSAQQQAALSDYYSFRMAERERVAGIETQAWVFEPKDGLRYGHKFWADAESGLLVKARIVDERNEVIEQFAFTEILIGVKIDREQVNPTWAVTPPDWQVRQLGKGDAESRETGWTVTRVPPGFIKIVDGFRRLRGARDGGAPRLLGWPRRGLGVHRADRRRFASDRNLPAGWHQCRRPAAGRQSHHRAGGSARRHRSADRALRGAPLTVNCSLNRAKEVDFP
jgi:sigma-E factor negative regulatory protein RseB